jgi:hypothetical protein
MLSSIPAKTTIITARTLSQDALMDSDNSADNTAKDAADGVAADHSGRCLLYGCSAVFITGIFLILCAGFGTYVYFTRQVKSFTSETPQILPSQEYDAKKMIELETRVQRFEQVLASQQESAEGDVGKVADQESVVDATQSEQSGDSNADESKSKNKNESKSASVSPPEQLVLSAADLNALISRHPRFKKKLFVKIDQGVITGELSLPLDGFVPGGEGRFFNGAGQFDVSLQEGELIVQLVDATVAGQPIPPAVMAGIRKQNLAEKFQEDAKLSRMLKKFEQIEVDGDRVILTLKRRSPADPDQDD